MEEKVFYRIKRQAKVYLIWSGVSFVFLLVSFFTSNTLYNSNNFLYIGHTIVPLILYYVSTTWYVKTTQEAIYVKSNLLKAVKIPYSEIQSHKVLVTGDLELKLQSKQIEISKDILNTEDFQELTQIVNKAKQ